MRNVFLRAIFLWFCTALPFECWAIGEAFVVEGAVGSTASSIYNASNELVEPAGQVAMIRFYLPISQKRAHKIWALTLSSQIYDARQNGPAADQVQLLYYTAAGVGVNYRWHIFTFGTEYQLASMRQSVVGTNTSITNFSLGMPHAYAGILWRLGTLGMGLSYSYKQVTVPAASLGLSEATTYTERNALFSLTYHFDGGPKSFIKSLFKSQQKP